MSENVKVIVRCRPLNEKEITAVVVCVDPIERQVTLTQKGTFSFFHCYLTFCNADGFFE